PGGRRGTKAGCLAACRGRRPPRGGEHPRRVGVDLDRRECERDAGTALRTVLGPDVAAVCLDETACDRQPETGSAAASRPIGPPEALEHPRRSLLRHAVATVLYTDEQIRGTPLDSDCDRAVCPRA